MIHTSHHEFGHILHQTIRYPDEFKFVNSKLALPGYTSTWFNISDEQALQNGYITAYAMATYDEDFVEMISGMLLEGRSRFNELVASVNPTAQQALREKERRVVEYFSNVWKIDFYSLQTRVQAALNSLVVPETIEQAYGFQKTYSTASVNPANQTLLPQSAYFNSLFNTSASNVAAIPGYNLTLDSLAVIYGDVTTMVLRMYITQNNNVFVADYTYTISKTGNVYSYTFVGAVNSNATVIQSAVTPLLDYYSTNQFKLSWYADPSVSIYPRVKFTPQSTPSRYFIGLLLP
jgi:hypothetical protein